MLLLLNLDQYEAYQDKKKLDELIQNRVLLSLPLISSIYKIVQGSGYFWNILTLHGLWEGGRGSKTAPPSYILFCNSLVTHSNFMKFGDIS